MFVNLSGDSSDPKLAEYRRSMGYTDQSSDQTIAKHDSYFLFIPLNKDDENNNIILHPKSPSKQRNVNVTTARKSETIDNKSKNLEDHDKLNKTM